MIASARSRGSSPFACIGDDLAEVDRILREQAESSVHRAEELCRYVHDSGGKRLRPALVVLSCRALTSDSVEPLYAGAAAEMIHAATLLHDDVVDGAASRRGRATAAAQWGRTAAIASGNLLFTRAFGMLAERGQVEVLRVLSSCMLTMCRGEILQNARSGDLDLSEAAYFEIIRAKTADFLSVCCRMGGMLAGADPPAIERLAEFGMNLGLAFQVTDDLLDLFGDPSEIGKPIGGDLRERKTTLPLLLGLRDADARDRCRLRKLAALEPLTDEAIDEIRSLLRRAGAVDATRRAVQAVTDDALKRLDPLPDTPARRALESLVLDLSTRTR